MRVSLHRCCGSGTHSFTLTLFMIIARRGIEMVADDGDNAAESTSQPVVQASNSTSAATGNEVNGRSDASVGGEKAGGDASGVAGANMDDLMAQLSALNKS